MGGADELRCCCQMESVLTGTQSKCAPPQATPAALPRRVRCAVCGTDGGVRAARSKDILQKLKQLQMGWKDMVVKQVRQHLALLLCVRGRHIPVVRCAVPTSMHCQWRPAHHDAVALPVVPDGDGDGAAPALQHPCSWPALTAASAPPPSPGARAVRQPPEPHSSRLDLRPRRSAPLSVQSVPVRALPTVQALMHGRALAGPGTIGTCHAACKNTDTPMPLLLVKG